jgi:hypothetical protein
LSESSLQAITEPENRMGLFASLMVMKAFYKRDYRSGVPSVFVADENVLPLHWGYVMKTPLRDIISSKALQLQEAGIWTRHFKNAMLEDFRSKPEEIGPQVLTLQHLSAGFVVIVTLLSLSVAVFAVEVSAKLWRKLLPWLGKAVFCCVVLKFTRINKLM